MLHEVFKEERLVQRGERWERTVNEQEEEKKEPREQMGKIHTDEE